MSKAASQFFSSLTSAKHFGIKIGNCKMLYIGTEKTVYGVDVQLQTAGTLFKHTVHAQTISAL